MYFVSISNHKPTFLLPSLQAEATRKSRTLRNIRHPKSLSSTRTSKRYRRTWVSRTSYSFANVSNLIFSSSTSRRLICNNFFLFGLMKFREELVSKMFYCQCTSDDYIFRQNDDSSSFFLIG